MKRFEYKTLPACMAALITSILFFAPQGHALAGEGAALPFDDPTWQLLICLALLVNAGLYVLVWRKRPHL